MARTTRRINMSSGLYVPLPASARKRKMSIAKKIRKPGSKARTVYKAKPTYYKSRPKTAIAPKKPRRYKNPPQR